VSSALNMHCHPKTQVQITRTCLAHYNPAHELFQMSHWTPWSPIGQCNITATHLGVWFCATYSAEHGTFIEASGQTCVQVPRATPTTFHSVHGTKYLDSVRLPLAGDIRLFVTKDLQVEKIQVQESD